MEEQKVRARRGASCRSVFECVGAEQTAGQKIDTPRREGCVCRAYSVKAKAVYLR